MKYKNQPKCDELCWIHIEDLILFTRLGVYQEEKTLGQNIRLNVSIQIPFTQTQDLIKNTVNYGTVISSIREFVNSLGTTNLIEYFAEQILIHLGQEFPEIHACKIRLQKLYIPVDKFAGALWIEAERIYHKKEPLKEKS